MSPKRELSLDQIQEIRALRDKLPAAEAKKRFGIGSTRLYKIWRDAEPSGPLEPAGPQSLLPAAAPTVEDIYDRLGRLESHAAQATGRPLEPAQAGPQSLLSSAAPTIEDFYNRLGRLESRAEQATGLLVEVLEQLAQRDDPLDELQEEMLPMVAETAEEVQEARDEQTETRMDLREMAKTAQTWIYNSFAVLVAWKVAVHTWNQCTPALDGTTVGRDNAGSAPQDEELVAVAEQQQQHDKHIPNTWVCAKPGNPHYMV